MTEKRPVYPIHPSAILADELAELQMSAAELARELHMSSNWLFQMIADTAERIAQAQGTQHARTCSVARATIAQVDG